MGLELHLWDFTSGISSFLTLAQLLVPEISDDRSLTYYGGHYQGKTVGDRMNAIND